MYLQSMEFSLFSIPKKKNTFSILKILQLTVLWQLSVKFPMFVNDFVILKRLTIFSLKKKQLTNTLNRLKLLFLD